MDQEKAHSTFVRGQIEGGTLTACHDVSDGGTLVALAEMAMAGGKGISLEHEGDHGFWFGEDQGRYILVTSDGAALEAAANAAGLSLTKLGSVDGDSLMGQAIEGLKQANEDWMPSYMATV